MPELEAQLRALAADAVWPPTPDLQARVLARLESAPAAPAAAATGVAPAWRRRPRRLLVAVMAALVLTPAAAAVAFPDARDEVLEWLGLRNVTVRRVPPPPAARPQLEEDLGRLVTLAELIDGRADVYQREIDAHLGLVPRA